MEKQTRSILAILYTDIPEYTKKTEEDESHAFSLIAKHRDIINKHVVSSNGFTLLTATAPIDGLVKPSITFIVVDFPAPLGRRIPLTPGSILSVTLEIPCTRP